MFIPHTLCIRRNWRIVVPYSITQYIINSTIRSWLTRRGKTHGEFSWTSRHFPTSVNDKSQETDSTAPPWHTEIHCPFDNVPNVKPMCRSMAIEVPNFEDTPSNKIRLRIPLYTASCDLEVSCHRDSNCKDWSEDEIRTKRWHWSFPWEFTPGLIPQDRHVLAVFRIFVPVARSRMVSWGEMTVKSFILYITTSIQFAADSLLSTQ
jgi:hypothetical protein